MRIFLLAILLSVFTFSGFNQTSKKIKTKKTKSGLRYKILDKHKGPRIGEKDFIEVHIQTFTENDSLIFSTYKIGGTPVAVEMHRSGLNKFMLEGIQLLTGKDSALFLIPADSVFKSSEKPSYVKEGDRMKYLVKIVSHTTEEELIAQRKEQREKDEIAIQDYLKRNDLISIKTESGLHVVTKEVGPGRKPNNGDKLKVHYRGQLLNGFVFDNSYKRNRAFEFVLGKGQVIPGWEEGLGMINRGGKALLLIPSYLAYGEREAGGGQIPPNSVLIFLVELVNIN